jgi:hypothetical protein
MIIRLRQEFHAEEKGREACTFNQEFVFIEIYCRDQMSDVRCQGSGIRDQGSDVRCQMSDVRCQMSGIRDQGSDVRCQMSDVRDQKKSAAQSAVEGGKTPRPNISAAAKPPVTSSDP